MEHFHLVSIELIVIIDIEEFFFIFYPLLSEQNVQGGTNPH